MKKIIFILATAIIIVAGIMMAGSLSAQDETKAKKGTEKTYKEQKEAIKQEGKDQKKETEHAKHGANTVKHKKR